MLKLSIQVSEDFDDETNEFVSEFVDVELEHSLVSLSKWEMIWEKPLLTMEEKTSEMNLSYLQCMCLTPDVAPEVFEKLDEEQQTQISDYLEKNHTATWFSDDSSGSRNARIITAELIYYWMDSFSIDWQAQYWPINRLLTLIRVHSAEQDQKTPRRRTRDRMSQIATANAARRKELNTTG